MEKIVRDVRTCTVADIHERYIMGGYVNIELPNEVDKEKQDALIKCILNNLPLPSIVLISYYNTERSMLLYHIVRGKEWLELLLDYILKNEKKDSNVWFDMVGLTQSEKHDFWHYHVSQHYISTELSEEERIEVEKLYAQF